MTFNFLMSIVYLAFLGESSEAFQTPLDSNVYFFS